MGSTLFRNPRALSSALATLGSPQSWALGFLNSVDPLVLPSNYYVDFSVAFSGFSVGFCTNEENLFSELKLVTDNLLFIYSVAFFDHSGL